MKQTYTAMIQQSDGWWIGWVQEIRGINCQERTQEELLDSLKSAVEDMLELNRDVAIRRAEGEYQTIPISV
jgi:predicted RNase H-like HicB family nuclease